MTIANVLTIGTYYRWVKVHPDRGLLTRSCRSPVVLHDFKSIGPYFAYILPSALVIVYSLISHVHLTDYGLSTFQSSRLYV